MNIPTFEDGLSHNHCWQGPIYVLATYGVSNPLRGLLPGRRLSLSQSATTIDPHCVIVNIYVDAANIVSYKSVPLCDSKSSCLKCAEWFLRAAGKPRVRLSISEPRRPSQFISPRLDKHPSPPRVEVQLPKWKSYGRDSSEHQVLLMFANMQHSDYLKSGVLHASLRLLYLIAS